MAKTFTDLNKNNLKNYGQWLQPTLSGTFWCHWHEAEGLEKITSNYHFHQVVFLNGHSLMFQQDVKFIEAQAARLLKKESAAKLAKAIDELGRSYEKDLDNLREKKFSSAEYIRELFRTCGNAVGLWWYCIPLGEALEQKIVQKWQIQPEQGFELFKPIKATWLEQQSKDIKKFAKLADNKNLSAIKKNKQLWDLIEKHVEKFKWFGTHHWEGEPYSLKKCLKQIREQKPARLTKKINPHSPIPKEIITLARTLSYWRTHCAEITAKAVYLSRPALTKLAKLWKMSYGDLTHLSHKEISQNLGKNILPKKLLLQIPARKKAYGCILNKKGNEEIFVAQKLIAAVRKLVNTTVAKTEKLSGLVASKGQTIKGRAVIVMSPKDFKDFRKGDILVTNETTPDFVPLMKTASAVITDVGGMTSHAAIVCRELQIPCIVGTKHATKILKKADIIEVDTNIGTIVKLK